MPRKRKPCPPSSRKQMDAAVRLAKEKDRELDRELAKMGPFTDPAEDEDEDGNVETDDDISTIET